jgi:hypothetical protein
MEERLVQAVLNSHIRAVLFIVKPFSLNLGAQKRNRKYKTDV